MSSASFEQDRDLLLERLNRQGMSQVVIVDLSQPHIDIGVVRAVIPGLEAPHDDPDFIPGVRVARVQEQHT